MREIAYRNLTSPKYRRKVMSVREKNETKEARTRTCKTFIYIVENKMKLSPGNLKPSFHITKTYNSKTKTEKFLLRVKGLIYVTKDRHQFPVHYCHSLKIDIKWKKKTPFLNTVT